MRQVLIKNGKAYVDNVPTPNVEEGVVLVRVLYSCVSKGTELTGISNSGKSILSRIIEKPERLHQTVQLIRDQGLKKTKNIIENRVLPSHKPIGYSASGTVINLGTGVRGFKIGDNVACAGNRYAYHADFIAVPQNLVVKIPKNTSLSDASTVALGAIALQGVRRTKPSIGDTVCVIGLGIIGQLSVQLLIANGCRVIGVDIDSSKIELALCFGMNEGINPTLANAPQIIDQITGGHGADSVIITAATSSNEVISEAFQICRKKGKVILVGDVGLSLERKDFYSKEIDFLISTSYGPGRYDSNYEEQGIDYPYAYVRWTENRNMATYLDLLAEGKICISQLITQTVPIESAHKIYDSLLIQDSKALISLISYNTTDQPLHTISLKKGKESIGRVRIALIGAGNFAKSTHLPLLKSLKKFYDLRAIVSQSGPNAKTIASKFDVPIASTSYSEILNKSDIDAVLITTRHNLHAKMVIDALKAGKHVLVEKPLSLTEDELTKIESFFLSSENEKPLLMTGFNRRFSNLAIHLKNALKNRINPMVINYLMNAGYQPPDSWVHGSEGGGRNRGEACHIYDLFTFLTDAHFVDINYSSIKPQTGYYRMDDNFITTISFEDGSIANLIYTSMGSKDYPKEKLDLFCDGWTAELIDFKSLKFFGKKEENINSKLVNKGHGEELKAFANSILNTNDWPIPLWQQLQATRISWVGL